MLNRAALTALYLDEIRRRGAKASDLLGSLPASELLNTIYHRRYLPRPLFIGQAEREQLHADLAMIHAAMVSLPDRLFGGDLKAFARAVGASDYQVSAALRSWCRPVSRLARADLYADQSGFRLLEFNFGSTIGGMECSDMCRALLEHPVLADFARTHQLGYVDTMHELANNIFAETGAARGSFPVVAVTDWPSSYEKLAPYLRRLAAPWRELGLDTYGCHLGELEVRGGRVWLRGRMVDVIYRIFLIECLLEPGAPTLLDPILDAVARDEVTMFTQLECEVFGSKGALAMLSDERNRRAFSAAELVSIDRILPWTRMVRPGPVTLEDGRRVDLPGYAIAHQDDLVLKPAMMAAGRGVLLGWHRDTSPQLWREQVTKALGTPCGYVIQRRVRPVPELFPDDSGELAPWTVAWGVFTGLNGYGGAFARATPAASDLAVINMDAGASAGCCLSTTARGTR